MKTTPVSMNRLCTLTFLGALAVPGQAQLFENLAALSNRIKVGDPHYYQDDSNQWQFANEAPKGMAAGDLDGDGHADWVVTRLDGKLGFAYGLGNGKFEPLVLLPTPAGSFRQLLAADLNGDGRLDLAGCDPFQGIVYIFTNNGTRTWDQPAAMTAWEGARNLAAGDFNGDGVADLIVAGPDRDQSYDWIKLQPVNPPPVTPQPAHGVAYFRGLGAGDFAPPAYLPGLATVGRATIDDDDSFPRPVYSLKTWRPPGATQDRLVAAHASSSILTDLGDDGLGRLTAGQTLQARGAGIRALAIGPLYHEKDSGIPDLVVANRDLGLVEVFRGTRTLGFTPTPAAAYVIPNGPRALDMADLNRDGWLDLAVAQRYGNKIALLDNKGGGVLEKSSETASGWSPREMVSADFDEDGRTDIAVLNRDSVDVSILLANPTGIRTGFKALDQIYPTSGDVAQLAIQDLNGDGRGDILQLHRLSEEVSIRMSLPGGKLGPASFFKMGTRPESLSLTDADNDGKQDLVTTNIGDALGGLYAVRAGDGAGGFGPVTTYRPPLEQAFFNGPASPSTSLPAGVIMPPAYGNLFSVLSVDLDNDGIKDLLAGYYDCRGVVLKGKGDGTYITPPASSVFSLAYESRYMVHGDFDQDSDEDVAVVSYTGAMVVLENRGNAFLVRPDEPPFVRSEYAAPSGFAGASGLVAADLNGDGDLDLLNATGQGIQVLLGRPGMAFRRQTFPSPSPDGAPILTLPGLTFPVQAMAWGRFDADADLDLATICKNDGCLRISTGTADGVTFGEALAVDCPQTDYLVAGDVDGDGQTDLAGTGSVLWVALSSRATQPTQPMTNESIQRVRLPGLVINEITPRNDSIPINLPDSVPGSTVPSFFSKRPDCVEIYNGSAEGINLAGWKLEYTTGGQPRVFPLPADTIPAGGYRVVLFYDKKTPVSAWRTGFPLAKEGGTLRLLRPAGGSADEVTYPEIATDLSYARFSDGDLSWGLTALPNPGFSNEAGGPIEPKAKLNGIDLAEFAALKRVRFYATATDDLGVLGMTIHWRRTGQNSPFSKVLLYDDGLNGDGGRLDGVFSGLFTNAPAGGTAVEFYLETEDLSGIVTRQPGPPPGASDEAGPLQLYTLVLPTSSEPPNRGLEISEMMPSGSTLADPTGSPTNWVEIRNTSDAPLSLDKVELADSLFDGGSRAIFPDNITLSPGEHRIVWSRPIPLTGVLSGDLKLGSTNEEIALVRRDATGSQQILSFLQGGPVPYGWSAARIGAGGPVIALPPTPGLINVGPQDLVPFSYQKEDGPHFSLVYPTIKGELPRVEWSLDLNNRNWLSLDTLPGDGFERVHDETLSAPARFFRLRY